MGVLLTAGFAKSWTMSFGLIYADGRKATGYTMGGQVLILV